MADVVDKPLVPERPVRFSVVRVPFFLEPDYPRSPAFQETNRERLIRKWGGAAEFEAQKSRHQLKERGQAVGIQHFNLDRVASSTFLSHRLVQWVSKEYGLAKSEALYNVLNRRHFEEGQKLNDAAMLAEAAAEAGVDGAAAAAFMASDAGEAEIKRSQEMLRHMGVHSIPTFIIQGRYSLSGAAHAEELGRLFREIEASGEEGEPVFAPILGIPPERVEEGLPLIAAAAQQ